MKRLGMVLLAVLFLVSCQKGGSPLTIDSQPYGVMEDGRSVELFTLSNGNMTVKITNYGAIITHILVPDRQGQKGDVVLGFDSLAHYLAGNPYFGCIVGRYGNRIANARFKLSGKIYPLAANNGPNHLHGGKIGFDQVLWDAKPVKSKDAVAVEMSYLSPDGNEGYPGNLKMTVTYALTVNNEVRLDYQATTDKKTVVNLTNHTYFNLKDGGRSPILDHVLQIDAGAYTPVNAGLIPTGELAPVDNTPFDFRTPKSIGERIEADHEQIRFGGGYDQNWVLAGEAGTLRKVVRVTEAESGRIMDVMTTEPGVQFYTGNFLDGSRTGKNGIVYHKRHGLCLETQHYPDSPNQPDFPSTELNPGETYHTTTVYRFSTDAEK